MSEEVIECDMCKRVINGESLWVISDFEEPMTICEKCYELFRAKFKGEN